ncbi:inositol polyphosphate-5-phosphatase A isoform X2 [Lucilia cuprina]|uniref:inositol polyphosphate-5-phosphatase A isoform X2 n=1 Tax=Lucilia cuprina TaxID=7375 RepID=UPI001F05BC57|nr:inositol polyphosphate-5-phosphatase A isoform X2 [Lucilia cuprina]
MDSSTSTAGCDDDIDVLLVTANVGSLFEDPLRLLRPWLVVFLKKVEELQPKFLALHLQEVGGKTYEKSMEYVQEFIKSLCEAPQMLNFEFIRIYMDEDFNSAEHFTALGNLYFVHNSLKVVKMWNFLTHNWESAEGKNIYSGNIETISTKEKSKFPQHFFPECKWSRKGFMRTRWDLNNTVFDLVNIHLFHDASNLAACEEFPSVYCKTRRRALVHTLERFHLDEKNGLAPFFVFGDFNFRCDTEGVIKELTENLTAHRIHSTKNDCTKVHYRNAGGDNILTVGKKEFNHADHQLKFKESWLKKFDRELEPLTEFLIEFPINFPPSYPYEEDPEMPTDYMSTRCPSWCDRILMSVQAKEIIHKTESPNIYSIMGEEVCMGDHKPVYLNIRLKSNQGIDKYVACIPNKLQVIINDTLGDEVVWKEQCQLDVSAQSDNLSCINAKTRYIQIHSLNTEDSIICSNSSNTDYEKLNRGIVAVSGQCDVSQMTLNNIENNQPLSSILKETTV